MIRAIVRGHSRKECERLYRRYCDALRIPCRAEEAVFLSSDNSPSKNAEKVRGSYNDVVEGRVHLVNMTLQDFKFLYSGCF